MYMLNLKCKKCGSRNTVTKSADVLKDENENIVGYRIGGVTLNAKSGFVNSEEMAKIIGTIAEALKYLFKYLGIKEQNKVPIVACKDCGHYEKIG